MVYTVALEPLWLFSRSEERHGFPAFAAAYFAAAAAMTLSGGAQPPP